MNGPVSTTAAILVGLKQPLVIDEIALPETLEAGQVLVEIHYSGICGSQLGEIDGVKGEDRFLPHLLGHEGSGIVLDVGAGVRHVAKGDHVVLHWRKGVGIESAVPAYAWKGKKLNAGWVTTFNRHAVVAENRVTRIPAGSDLAIAALFGCAVTTGFGVVQNNAHVRIGESVVVFGAGGVGLNIVQAAALVSAHPLIAVDLYDNRLALASQMGATHVINAKNEDAFGRVRAIVGPGGVDHFIDNTGQPAIIQAGYELTGPRGRVTLVGVPRKGADITVYSLPLHFGKALSGSHGGETVPEQDIPRYHALFTAGRIKLRELVTETRPLDEVNTAIERMRDGSVSGRCLIDMKHEA